MAQRQGISLIAVPCWWDGSSESLEAMINFQRPDLIPTFDGLLVSLNPPLGFFNSTELPGVGELMLASFPLDTKFISKIPHNSWWIGEKYDGVRFCWLPNQSVMRTRAAKEIDLLPKLQAGLPCNIVEGELCFGRGNFSHTYMLFQDLVELVSWHLLRVVCFDIPAYRFQKCSFEERYTALLSSISLDHPTCIVATRMLCKDGRHLNSVIFSIIDDGGEGAILRKAGSKYEHGRNSSLIKLKTFYSDQEGLVVKVNYDGITVALARGQRVEVPIERIQTTRMPREGEIVTLAHDIAARRDIPVNPVVTRIRADVDWSLSVSLQLSQPRVLNEQSKEFKSKPMGYWTMNNMRSYLVQLARKYNLDPLLPDTWSEIPVEAIYSTKGGRIILQKFKGHFLALKTLFPNIGLVNKTSVEKSSYNDKKQRRKFFERYAQAKGFDPLVADNWYSQTTSKILAYKDGARVLLYHKNKFYNALLALFPNIGLNISYFKSPIHDVRVRRKFFENFAKEKHFDPLVPDNWYQQSRRYIVNFKGSQAIIGYYKQNVSLALMDVFPKIGLDKSKLWIKKSPRQQTGTRHDEGRRDYFIEYAKYYNFDPLVPDNWYSQSKTNFLLFKGASTVLAYHNNSMIEGVLDLFPEIGLDRSKFRGQINWADENVRRNLFETYAEENKFDPLNPYNWYLQPREKILGYKGTASALHYHKANYKTALLHLFPEIGLERSKFLARSAWGVEENRRKFFEMYAKANNFDPLVAREWYSQSADRIMASRGASSVIIHYGNKLTKALISLFPHIGLVKSRLFQNSPASSVEKRRAFFENYAKDNSFDPLIPDHWYSQSIAKIKATRGAKAVIEYYNSSVASALIELFPSIGLADSKLPKERRERT